jgi:DNA-binding MarR family transcriptional regulator
LNERIDFTAEELSDLAHELRHLWHALVGGLRNPGPLEGLQRQQFWVLGALAHGTRRMSDLAEDTQTSQASLTGIVDRLEEHGLVQRVRSADDRRVIEVALTQAGREEMKLAHAAMLQRLEAVLAPLDDQERREFARLVGVVVARAGETGTGCP